MLIVVNWYTRCRKLGYPDPFFNSDPAGSESFFEIKIQPEIRNLAKTPNPDPRSGRPLYIIKS